MHKITNTIKMPRTCIGTRNDTVSREGLSLCFWYNDRDLYTEEEATEKLNAQMKKINPNGVDYFIDRTGYRTMIEIWLEKYDIIDFGRVTDIKLPKINVITISKENVLKIKNNKNALKNFFKKIDYPEYDPDHFDIFILTSYLDKNTDEPLRFEVIFKDTEVTFDDWAY